MSASGREGGQEEGQKDGKEPSRPIVVKLGGDVFEPASLSAIAAALPAVITKGWRPLIVHGGGPQATALSERLGLTPVLVGGRRVTDAATLDVIKMVVAGKLNVDLVAALRAAGVAAVGLAGAGGVVRAVKRPPRVVAGGGDAPVDFGWVGDVTGFDLPLLSLLQGAGYLPVVASLGLAEGGVCLNINADVVASQLAAAVGATALVAVTRVGGVRRDKDDPATRIPRLTAAEARAAIADGTVRGGMIPKLEEAFAPLAAGVSAVHIVASGELGATLDRPGSVGTVLVAG